MNKEEALAVLHELYETWKESPTISCVSLDGSQISHIFTGGYQIRMKCELDSYSRDILKGITKKHNLAVSEKNGFVIISSI
jgi:hypothetical protein